VRRHRLLNPICNCKKGTVLSKSQIIIGTGFRACLPCAEITGTPIWMPRSTEACRQEGGFASAEPRTRHPFVGGGAADRPNLRTRQFSDPVGGCRPQSEVHPGHCGDVKLDHEHSTATIDPHGIQSRLLTDFDYPIRTTYLLTAGQILRSGIARIPYPGGLPRSAAAATICT